MIAKSDNQKRSSDVKQWKQIRMYDKKAHMMEGSSIREVRRQAKVSSYAGIDVCGFYQQGQRKAVVQYQQVIGQHE